MIGVGVAKTEVTFHKNPFFTPVGRNLFSGMALCAFLFILKVSLLGKTVPKTQIYVKFLTLDRMLKYFTCFLPYFSS